MKFLHTILSLVIYVTISPALNAEEVKQDERKTPATQPEGWFYGAGAGFSQSIYKEKSTDIIPLPIIGFKGKKLSIYGPFINYTLARIDALTLFAQFAPRFQGYEARDSAMLSGMATRKKTLDGGFGLKINIENWELKGDFLADLLANSNGTEIRSSISRRFNYGPVFISPSLAFHYLSNDHVDYYYGVERDEARLDRPVYRGTDTLNTLAGVTIATPIFFGGMTRLNLGYTWYGDTIRQSPLVDADSALYTQILFSKFF